MEILEAFNFVLPSVHRFHMNIRKWNRQQRTNNILFTNQVICPLCSAHRSSQLTTNQQTSATQSSNNNNAKLTSNSSPITPGPLSLWFITPPATALITSQLRATQLVCDSVADGSLSSHYRAVSGPSFIVFEESCWTQLGMLLY